jgi:uncharacterized membrane protein
MTINPIIYAVIAGVSMGLWIVFHKLASAYIPQVLGAITVSAVAVIAGIIILLFQKETSLNFSWPIWAFIFVVCAGLCAISLDIFTLKAFSMNLPASIGGPLIVGLGTALPPLIGALFLKEPLDWQALGSIAMITIGCAILATK